ncbi:MAG: hypothetical protein HXY34_13655 [Candidatus Thorarchaeota archaeon]|nr:hypothetical protein [Candidatus Thorarchaeota archaeon]
MSLLGPDDFGLGRKGRAKKLARDLSPELHRTIEQWLEETDESVALDRIRELVGPEEAALILRHHREKSRTGKVERRISADRRVDD